MLADDLAPETVACYSGLPLEKVLELKEKLLVKA